MDTALDARPSPRQYHQYWLWERSDPSLVHDHPGRTPHSVRTSNVSAVADEFDILMTLWEEGTRCIAAAEPSERRLLERVSDEILHDLRRRLGGKFTAAELARYYLDFGTDWCFQLACTVAPGSPEAWDTGTVAADAFARYARQASDYGGGVRVAEAD